MKKKIEVIKKKIEVVKKKMRETLRIQVSGYLK